MALNKVIKFISKLLIKIFDNMFFFKIHIGQLIITMMIFVISTNLFFGMDNFNGLLNKNFIYTLTKFPETFPFPNYHYMYN